MGKAAQDKATKDAADKATKAAQDKATKAAQDKDAADKLLQKKIKSAEACSAWDTMCYKKVKTSCGTSTLGGDFKSTCETAIDKVIAKKSPFFKALEPLEGWTEEAVSVVRSNHKALKKELRENKNFKINITNGALKIGNFEAKVPSLAKAFQGCDALKDDGEYKKCMGQVSNAIKP